MADLTTLGAVKNWQGSLAPSNTSADALLSGLISATSADFLRAIDRPDLLQNTYTESRIGDGSARLVLRHWPVTAVTTLKIGTATVPAQNDASDPAVDGWSIDTNVDPERRFVLYLSGALAFTDTTRISVAYVAGYSTAPADIAQAVTEWVVFRYARKSSAGQTQARTLEGESTHFEEFDIPPNAKRVIAAYKRRFAAYGADAADAAIGGDAPAAGMRGRGQAR